MSFSSFAFHKNFVFRSPSFPFNKNTISEKAIKEIANREEFQEAIYIASPVLFDEMQWWLTSPPASSPLTSPRSPLHLERGQGVRLDRVKEVRKLIYSLHKYYSRISSRCTPYGLFASCSVGQWNAVDSKDLTGFQNLPGLMPYTRFDMDFVCSLGQYLVRHPAIQPHLLFFPNNSIYFVGGELRYVQYKVIENKRMHSISSAIKSEYLEKALEMAKEGVLLSSIGEDLVNDIVSVEDANNFIKELVESQLLVSELEPNITGREYIYELIERVEEINKVAGSEEIKSIISILKQINSPLSGMPKPVQTIHPGGQVRHDSPFSLTFSPPPLPLPPSPTSPHAPSPIGEGNGVRYRQIFNSLKAILPETKENNLFQVDSFRPVEAAQLNTVIQSKLLKTIEFLTKLATPFSNTNLNDFKKRFNENYEGREVPLLEVLDTETGIGYPNKDTTGVNELVDDLPVGTRTTEYQLKWNNKEAFLLKKLVEAAKRDEFGINFTDEDVKDFKSENIILPVTMSCTFKVIDPQNNRIQFMNMSGSAANLLGRFAQGNEQIYNIIMDIADFEKNACKAPSTTLKAPLGVWGNDSIIAEIVHLSESRIGNILLRPVFSDYEIPYLAKSSLSLEFQIPLNDLVVSIKNNRLFLRSKRLNKEILPRLSTAHNYSFNSLPAYKFLCDLQMQDVTIPGLMFSWGVLSKSFKFLPRAEYEGARPDESFGRVIIHPATWNFVKADYETLLKNVETACMPSLQQWQTQWKMPRYISLKDADNELLIDLESELSVKVFLDTVKNRPAIELVEFLFDPKTALVRDSEGNPYNNEVIAVIFNTPQTPTGALSELDLEMAAMRPHPPTPSPMRPHPPAPSPIGEGNGRGEVKRSFIPGSKWLYYKIYCGAKTADKILVGTIKPLIEQLKRERLVEKWFFIRYSDPDTHIRLRLYNSDINRNADVSKIVYQSLNPLQQQGVVSKVLTDTYIRELERYGTENIENTEDYFEIDSMATIGLLDYSERERNEDIKWLYAARSTDYLFDSFGLNIEQKLKITETLKNNYFAEHGGQKDLKLQLDEKFRKLRPQIESFLGGKLDNDMNLFEVTSLLALKRDRIRLLADKILKLNETSQLGVEIPDLLGSYSHMAFNRIFKSKQRTYEMVIYDMLYRYYKSQLARAKK